MKVYGSLWVREHGEDPSKAFTSWAGNLSDDEARRVVARSRESLTLGNKFPPALGELTVWATNPTETEFFEIRARVMSGKHANEIERWMVATVRFNLRQVPENQFMKSLKSFYFQGAELKRAGNLFREQNEILSLPCESSVNLNDKIRNSFIPTQGVKNHVNSILTRMRRSQANQPVIDS